MSFKVPSSTNQSVIIIYDEKFKLKSDLNLTEDNSKGFDTKDMMTQSLFCASFLSPDFSEPDQNGHGEMLLPGSEHLHREPGFGHGV